MYITQSGTFADVRLVSERELKKFFKNVKNAKMQTFSISSNSVYNMYMRVFFLSAQFEMIGGKKKVFSNKEIPCLTIKSTS